MTPPTMPPQEVVERALSQSGGDDLAVLVQESSQVNLRWARNSLTTNGDLLGRDVDVVAFAPRRDGVGTATVSGQVQDHRDIADLVGRARAAAAAAAPAEDADRLPDGGRSQGWDDPVERTGADAITSLARQLGDAFRRGSGDGIEHSGYAEHDVTVSFLGTTAGTRLRFAQPEGRLETTAKSADRSRSAWHGAASADLSGTDLAAIDDGLRQSLRHQQRRIDIAPGRHTVLLSPSAVADLMIELYWSADAESAAEGRSVFSAPDGGTRVGDSLGAPITLSSDPAALGDGMASPPFVASVASSPTSSVFDNGLALHPTDWISGGVLRHLITTRHTASRTGLPLSPPVDNLILSSPQGHGDVSDVVSRMPDGLLVTCLWYNRVVDPETLLLTGLTRDGVYVVRGGEVIGACGNFRFNESPVGLLRRIVDAGGTVRTLAREMGDYFNRAAMPPLVVGEFNLSTASDAQ